MTLAPLATMQLCSAVCLCVCQSLLLNVVSCMVDVCTSASLQLSSELDPAGDRTLLCLTKIDELQQRSLADIMETSIRTLNLRPEHVFAVRNRSQQEVSGVVLRCCATCR